MGGAGRGRVQVVEHEVPSGDRVDRVGRDLREPELAREHPPVGVEADPRQRPRAERQARGLAPARTRSARDRARASRSRRADGAPDTRAERAAGGCSRALASPRAPARAPAAPPSARRAPPRAAPARSRVYIARSVTTWSLRERAVCSFPPTGPASSVRRRSIAMWMSSSSGSNGKRSSASSRSTASKPGKQRIAVLFGDDPTRCEHASVRARLGDVVRPQPPVEVDRGVQPLKIGVLGLAEAGHVPESMDARPSPVCSAGERDPPTNSRGGHAAREVNRGAVDAPSEQRIVHTTDIITLDFLRKGMT